MKRKEGEKGRKNLQGGLFFEFDFFSKLNEEK